MADDNVVNFTKAKEERRLVWACSCGCVSFKLFADDEVECVNCGSTVLINGEWRKALPQNTGNAKELTGRNFELTGVIDVRDWLRKVISKTNEREVAAAILFFKDGNTSSWFPEINNQEQLRWLKGKMNSAYKSIARVIGGI
jgi:hypothetical protein